MLKDSVDLNEIYRERIGTLPDLAIATLLELSLEDVREPSVCQPPTPPQRVPTPSKKPPIAIDPSLVGKVRRSKQMVKGENLAIKRPADGSISPKKRWTPEEEAEIKELVEQGIGPSHFPIDFLPQRSGHAIFGRIQTYYTRGGRCSRCLSLKGNSKKSSLCLKCQTRRSKIRETPFSCTGCGEPVTYTLKRCLRCHGEKRHDQIRRELNRLKIVRCLPYVRSRLTLNLKNVTKVIRGEAFLDVFGGSGVGSMNAVDMGFKSVTYNDFDQGVFEMFNHLGGSLDERLKMWCTVKNYAIEGQTFEATVAAQQFIRVLGTQGVNFCYLQDKDRVGKTPQIAAWNLDCVEAVRKFQRMSPKGFLYMDMPYLDSSEMYDQSMDQSKVEELAKRLRKHKGRYLLCTSSIRSVIEAVGAKYLYTTAGMGFREVVCSNFPLTSRIVKKFDPKTYNLKRATL